MASHDSPDLIAEADRRAERAKASLRARIALLERRVGDVRDRLDVPAQIRRHPWPAVGVAFAIGALAGRRGRRSAAARVLALPAGSPHSAGGRSVTTTALAAIGAVAVELMRELAIAQLGRMAQRWWTEHDAPPDDPDR